MAATFAASLADRLDRSLVIAGQRDDPTGWVSDRLGEHLWSAQTEILESVRDNRLTAVQSCHGPGKSRVASRAAAWWLSTRPAGSARVITTAPTGDQVRGILWAEIHSADTAARERGDPLPGRLNEIDWKMGKIMVGMGRKPSDYNPHAFQGIHAPRGVLVIIDEACGVISHFWTAALSIATGEHDRVLALGNPDDPASEFARVCSSDRWHTIRISAFDTPNFTGEPVPPELAGALVGPAYVADMLAEYGENSPTYTSKVLGEFPDEAEDGVVRLSSLRACSAPEPATHTDDQLLPVELGVDLGAGGDETAIRERRGVRVGQQWTTRTRDPMAATGLIVQAIRESGATAVKVDVIGIGWGIVGRLRELHSEGRHNATVIGVNVAEAASRADRYLRKRSEIWWDVARRLSEDRAWDFSHLDEKDREQLISQLTAPRYPLDSSGRIVVEKKDDTRQRIGRSPDNADALLLAFYSAVNAPAGALDWLKAARTARP